MIRLVHPIAGGIALLTIGTFWLLTVLSELFGSTETIVAVKTTIPWGFFLLVPALAATGGSGLTLAGGRRNGGIGRKWKRMPFIAANGLLVLVPSALFLAAKARSGEFDSAFYVVQAMELVAGATNLTLLGLSMRDGLQLTSWRRNSMLRPAATHAVKLVTRRDVADGTVALHFAKPAGFEFQAGQAVYLSMLAGVETDLKGRVRTLSIASAPHEAELLLATRVSDSAFKRALMTTAIGTTFRMEGPYGSLTLHADEGRPAVFVAGGIGITPIRSIILDTVARRPTQRLILFYSNRSVEQAAFLAEFDELQQRHRNFTLVATLTDSEPAEGWRGERGYISKEMLSKHLGDLAFPIYYVVGPPQMSVATQALLRNADVPAAAIRMEPFPGY